MCLSGLLQLAWAKENKSPSCARSRITRRDRTQGTYRARRVGAIALSFKLRKPSTIYLIWKIPELMNYPDFAVAGGMSPEPTFRSLKRIKKTLERLSVWGGNFAVFREARLWTSGLFRLSVSLWRSQKTEAPGFLRHIPSSPSLPSEPRLPSRICQDKKEVKECGLAFLGNEVGFLRAHRQPHRCSERHCPQMLTC
jgi:hypothetical protein